MPTEASSREQSEVERLMEALEDSLVQARAAQITRGAPKDNELRPNGHTVTDQPYFHIQDQVDCEYCHGNFSQGNPGYHVNLVRREKSGVYFYDEGIWHRDCVDQANRENGYGF